ncbi:hypothetical protein E8P82_05240 [Arthrobacter echini]|uniref:DNA-binding protein n=1 Tax=Arthrobacter echini TaxID=1529066 RepID=A0A4V6S875_9MICC|nr:hypothetical protein E8P82_05240 [Arthrobacter echini]
MEPEHGSPTAPELPERGRIRVRGVIDRVTIAPASSSPSFSALARLDGTGRSEQTDVSGVGGSVRIIWMGQRQVPGIQAGVALRFEGMLSRVGGIPTVYNPRYEIIGRPQEY